MNLTQFCKLHLYLLTNHLDHTKFGISGKPYGADVTQLVISKGTLCLPCERLG